MPKTTANVPSSGRIPIVRMSGSIAAPLATISNSTGASFTIPAIAIPAGMLVPATSSLWASCRIRRTGATASAVGVVRLGNTNTTADNTMFANTGGATDANGIDIFSRASIATTTTYCAAVLGAPNAWTASPDVDRATNFDTSTINYVQFGISTANIADSFALLDYAVWIEY